MWNILRNLGAPVLDVADQFARNQVAAGIRRAGRPVVRAARNPSSSNLTRNLAAAQIVSNAPAMQGSAALFGGSVAIDASNRTGLTGQIEGALNQVGPAVDRFFGAITPQAIQQYGREQENQSLIQALDPTFGLLSTFMPGTTSTGPAPKRPIANLPADYKQTELAAGAAAEAYRPGAGFPGQQVVVDGRQSAVDRAYESEKRRALQLAEQDQLAKKYQVADLTKAYNTAATPEEKQRIGLQIWATTNPQLTQGVKPGQVGYEQAQAAINTPGLDQLSQSQKALLRQAFQKQLNK